LPRAGFDPRARLPPRVGDLRLVELRVFADEPPRREAGFFLVLAIEVRQIGSRIGTPRTPASSATADRRLPPAGGGTKSLKNGHATLVKERKISQAASLLTLLGL
jgi:hypothetical protein